MTDHSSSNARDNNVISSDKKSVFWDRVPLHPVFFVIYPLLFLVAHNGLSFWDGVPLLSVICIFVALLFGLLLYLFLRNVGHAALILSFWIILFFWTVPLCDFLRMNLPIRIGRSTPFYLLFAYPIGTFFFWRLKSDFRFTTRLLNSISSVLVILVFGHMGLNAISSAKVDQTVTQRQDQASTSQHSAAVRGMKELPDIYFMISDGYAGQYALEKIHRFDNTPFLSELEKRGFQIVKCSSSNYRETKLTPTSVLNMNYIDRMLTQEELKVKEPFQVKRIVYPYLLENELIQYLRPLGYRFVFLMNSFWKLNANVKNKPEFVISSTNNGEFLSLFYDSTLLCAVRQLNFYQELQRQETLTTLELLKNMPETYGSAPFLAYVHVFPPLAPYSFKADGSEQRFYWNSGLTPKAESEMYLEQLQYINNEWLKAIDSILSQSKREPIIVLISDHGSRLTTEYSHLYGKPEKEALTFYNNLISIRLPNGIRLDDADEMMTVNIFRMILNAVFDENYPMLEPRYWGERGRDKVRDITQEIRPVFEELAVPSPDNLQYEK